jgi:hypothetical protein
MSGGGGGRSLRGDLDKSSVEYTKKPPQTGGFCYFLFKNSAEYAFFVLNLFNKKKKIRRRLVRDQ